MKGSGNPQVGFIAQELKLLIPEVVDGQEGSYSLSYGNLVAVAFEGIKELNAKVENFIAQGIAQIKNLIVETLTANKVDTKELCVDGVCVTKDQFKKVFENSGTTSAAPSDGAASSGSASSSTDYPLPTTDFLSPIITIIGANPAEISIGSSYIDMGATVADNISNNLGYHTFVDGIAVSQVSLDTSISAVYTIDYVATDEAGNTATSTRSVIVSKTASESPIPEAVSETVSSSSDTNVSETVFAGQSSESDHATQ